MPHELSYQMSKNLHEEFVLSAGENFYLAMLDRQSFLRFLKFITFESKLYR
jgi:hypothetical protein